MFVSAVERGGWGWGRSVLTQDLFHTGCVKRFGVFTQMTRRQNFDAASGTVWTVFLVLSIGRHVKFDACASKF